MLTTVGWGHAHDSMDSKEEYHLSINMEYRIGGDLHACVGAGREKKKLLLQVNARR